MIYGIFSGYYSDWIVEGYFNNKEDAEKWVAFKNNKSGYDEYYIKELGYTTLSVENKRE